MDHDERRLTVRLNAQDRANLEAVIKLAGGGPLARRDASAGVRHALAVAAAHMQDRAQQPA